VSRHTNRPKEKKSDVLHGGGNKKRGMVSPFPTPSSGRTTMEQKERKKGCREDRGEGPIGTGGKKGSGNTARKTVLPTKDAKTRREKVSEKRA